MSDSALTDRHEAARRIAREAGQVALDYFRHRDELVVEMKGVSDYVTHADRDVENVIRRELQPTFPGDAFLGEETAAQFTGPVDRCWVVDPIDGTHNFLRGMPYWNVAIGYVADGHTRGRRGIRPAARMRCTTRRRGAGAWCQSRPARRGCARRRPSQLAGSYVVLGHHDRSFEAALLRHPPPHDGGGRGDAQFRLGRAAARARRERPPRRLHRAAALRVGRGGGPAAGGRGGRLPRAVRARLRPPRRRCASAAAPGIGADLAALVWASVAPSPREASAESGANGATSCRSRRRTRTPSRPA